MLSRYRVLFAVCNRGEEFASKIFTNLMEHFDGLFLFDKVHHY